MDSKPTENRMKKLILIILLISFLVACSRPPAQPWQPAKPKKQQNK
jgi:PBP1b-binding outer membrane lipoprotein LpoB